MGTSRELPGEGIDDELPVLVLDFLCFCLDFSFSLSLVLSLSFSLSFLPDRSPEKKCDLVWRTDADGVAAVLFAGSVGECAEEKDE